MRADNEKIVLPAVVVERTPNTTWGTGERRPHRITVAVLPLSAGVMLDLQIPSVRNSLTTKCPGLGAQWTVTAAPVLDDQNEPS